MKKQHTKNKHYREFLDEGLISFINEETIKEAISKIKGKRGKHIEEGQALLITLYYTGGRPNEVLRIKSKDVTIQNTYLQIKIKGSKRGLPRTIYIKKNHYLAKKLLKYVEKTQPDSYLFYHYRATYKRVRLTKKGEIKYLIETDQLVRYHVKKWLEAVMDEGPPPYFLRHNRFSNLAEKGATMDQLRMMKGSRTYESVTPYIHMSAESAKKLAKIIK